jgi:hypothetical protein
MADLRVFSKTDKGSTELATRSGALSMAQRRLLILVDGVRDVEQLSAIVPSGFHDALRVLEEGGFVVLTGQSHFGAGTDTVARAAAPSIPVAEMTSVNEARLRAMTAIGELLGPEASGLVAAIEAARTGAELRPLVREAEQLISDQHGPEAAQTFIMRIRRR